jgi:outer membrane protein TolC
LRLQNDRSRRTAQLATEASRREEARVTVNRFLNRDSSSPFPTLELPDIADALVLTTNLFRHATNTEPRLMVASREIRAAQARVEATRKSRLPNLAVGVEGRQFHGDGGFREGLFTVGFNLPWFNAARYRKEVGRDEARHSATRQEREALVQEVSSELHHRIAAIEAARREALVYRDELLPRSERAVQLALDGWMSSRMDAREMMDARRMQVEAQSMLARAIASQWIEMSDLVLCCGLSDLELLQQLGRPKPTP